MQRMSLSFDPFADLITTLQFLIFIMIVTMPVCTSGKEVTCPDFLECSTLLDDVICGRWFGNVCNRPPPSPFDPLIEQVRGLFSESSTAKPDNDEDTLDRIRSLLDCEQQNKLTIAQRKTTSPTPFFGFDEQPTRSTTIEDPFASDSDRTTRLRTQSTVSTKRTTPSLRPSTRTTAATTPLRTPLRTTFAPLIDLKKTGATIMVFDALPPTVQEFHVMNMSSRTSRSQSVDINRWRTDVPSPRHNSAAAYFNGHIYLIGGRAPNDVESSSSVDMYNVQNEVWSSGPSLSIGRSHGSAISVNNSKLIICGCGSMRSNCAYTCEMLESGADAWLLFNVPKCAVNTAITALGEKMYLVGGDCTLPQRFLYIYDTRTLQWQEGTSMSNSRLGHAAVLLPGDRLILVCGGLGLSPTSTRLNAKSEHLSSCELYDIQADTWITTSAMNAPRAQFVLAVAESRVFAIGGISTRGEALQSVEELYQIIGWRTTEWMLSEPTYSHTGIVF